MSKVTLVRNERYAEPGRPETIVLELMALSDEEREAIAVRLQEVLA